MQKEILKVKKWEKKDAKIREKQILKRKILDSLKVIND